MNVREAEAHLRLLLVYLIGNQPSSKIFVIHYTWLGTHITAIKDVAVTVPTHTYHTYAIHAYLMYEKNVKFEQSTVENEINWNRSIVERGFPCMTATEDHTGMVCSLCHKHCR